MRMVDHCAKLQATGLLLRLPQLSLVSCWCRAAKHTLLPNETVYTNVFFPVPQAEELYIRGFLPSIDNTHLTHHLVAYLCVDEMAAYTVAAAGEAVQPESAEFNGALLPVTCGYPLKYTARAGLRRIRQNLQEMWWALWLCMHMVQCAWDLFALQGDTGMPQGPNSTCYISCWLKPASHVAT